MNKFTVCLTGGIASGKTHVSDRFAELGACIIDTDVLARQVVEPGTVGLSKLVAAFGEHICRPDGHLDRGKLKQTIFSDQAKLQTVNDILHPLIWEAGKHASAQNNNPMEIWVIPLFNENTTQIHFDRVLVVDVGESIQLERIQQRDELDLATAQAIVDAQIPRKQRLLLATDVIANNGSLENLDENIKHVYRLYQALMKD